MMRFGCYPHQFMGLEVSEAVVLGHPQQLKTEMNRTTYVDKTRLDTLNPISVNEAIRNGMITCN